MRGQWCPVSHGRTLKIHVRRRSRIYQGEAHRASPLSFWSVTISVDARGREGAGYSGARLFLPYRGVIPNHSAFSAILRS